MRPRKNAASWWTAYVVAWWEWNLMGMSGRGVKWIDIRHHQTAASEPLTSKAGSLAEGRGFSGGRIPDNSLDPSGLAMRSTPYRAYGKRPAFGGSEKGITTVRARCGPAAPRQMPSFFLFFEEKKERRKLPSSPPPLLHSRLHPTSAPCCYSSSRAVSVLVLYSAVGPSPPPPPNLRSSHVSLRVPCIPIYNTVPGALLAATPVA
jgi:hypothetical protein